MGINTISIELPRELVRRVDQTTRRGYRNRAEVISTALESLIERQSTFDALRRDLRQQARRGRLKPSDVAAAIRQARSGR